MFNMQHKKVEEVNFLASAKFVPFTYQVKAEGVQAGEDGRKIVPAGTLYPANDDTAIGILLNDVDVTNGDAPASVIVEGWILEERLPEEVTTEAKTAMTAIKFKKIQ